MIFAVRLLLGTLPAWLAVGGAARIRRTIGLGFVLERPDHRSTRLIS